MDEDVDCTTMRAGGAEIYIRQVPPKARPLHSIASPAEYLKRFQLSLDFWSARNYLYSLTAGSNVLYKLYKHYFPAEYAASEAAFTIDKRSALSDNGNGFGAYSPREIEFFELVNNRLFPINLDSILDDSWEGQRVDLIPIEYYGHGFSIEEPQFEEYCMGWQLIASIFYYNNSDELDGLKEDPRYGPYIKERKRLEDGADIDLNLLRDLCNDDEAPEELGFLPLSHDVVHHMTDNLFIDPDDTYPVYDAMWSDGQETIDLLHHDHIAAHRIMDDCKLLTDWIEVDVKNFRKVIDVCKRSLKSKTLETQTQTARRRNRSRTGPSPVEHRVRVGV